MSENQLRRLSVLAGEKLKAQGRWITCAESCTGGGIAKAITDIAGSSAYFDRGFVTYSNAAKHDLLGVSEATLAAHGAVSEECGAGRSGALGKRHRRPGRRQRGKAGRHRVVRLRRQRWPGAVAQDAIRGRSRCGAAAGDDFRAANRHRRIFVN